jgi:hypothetical protein
LLLLWALQIVLSVYITRHRYSVNSS